MPKTRFGSHIDKAGDNNPLSANSSPPIRKAQYMIKNPKLNAMLTANPLFLAIIPRGAPIRIKMILAKFS